MPNGFEMYRVFCSTPGNLDSERELFQEITGKVNEEGGLEAGILFAPVTLRGAAASGGVNAAVRQNVRDADFFVQILGDSWGPPSAEFENLFQLARECHDDGALPMKEVELFLKNADARKLQPDVAQFREWAAGSGIRLSGFESCRELEESLADLLRSWRDSLKSGFRTQNS